MPVKCTIDIAGSGARISQIMRELERENSRCPFNVSNQYSCSSIQASGGGGSCQAILQIEEGTWTTERITNMLDEEAARCPYKVQGYTVNAVTYETE